MQYDIIFSKYFLGKDMEMYIHKVQYYETDKMGITHHSNYIRWMEEARVDMLEKIDFGYDKLESEGIISPVVGVECEYKESTRFAENIEMIFSLFYNYFEDRDSLFLQH